MERITATPTRAPSSRGSLEPCFNQGSTSSACGCLDPTKLWPWSRRDSNQPEPGSYTLTVTSGQSNLNTLTARNRVKYKTLGAANRSYQVAHLKLNYRHLTHHTFCFIAKSSNMIRGNNKGNKKKQRGFKKLDVLKCGHSEESLWT